MRRTSNPVLRVFVALAALGLLSAFSYPLVQEGYQKIGSSVYDKAQVQLLSQSLKEYLSFCPSPSWNVNTPTREILTALAVGVDRSFSGRAESFLPSSANIDNLAQSYRIVYKGPRNFKIIPRS